MIGSLAKKPNPTDHYSANGWIVEADHCSGFYRQPQQIGAFIPDVVATKGLAKVILEVENADSCTDGHSIRQLRVFSRNAQTIVVVPMFKNQSNDHILKLQSKLAEEKLYIEIHNIS